MFCIPGEKGPERYAQNRKHLIKAMFLCAIARPRYHAAGECIFDGKIGIWPFVETRIARRSSPYRPAGGTPETKVINCNKETYRRFIDREGRDSDQTAVAQSRCEEDSGDSA